MTFLKKLKEVESRVTMGIRGTHMGSVWMVPYANMGLSELHVGMLAECGIICLYVFYSVRIFRFACMRWIFV